MFRSGASEKPPPCLRFCLPMQEATMSLRPVKRLIKSKPAVEGAGVHLRRAFGFGNTSDFDPFLLLDDFRNDIPEDYLAGFPWHPHRGIETITYVLAGAVGHGGSQIGRAHVWNPVTRLSRMPS